MWVTHISEFFYPLVQHSNDLIYIFTDINEILKIIDKSQKKVGMFSKLLILLLLVALYNQTQLLIRLRHSPYTMWFNKHMI